MAIIELKGWYLPDYEPIKDVIKRPHNLRLSKNSLLKSGLRADFLNDINEVKETDWFEHYLEGEKVEFYIEGSGGYSISNIDIISREIYFTKEQVSSLLEPIIFLSTQNEYPSSSENITNVLTQIIEDFNTESRIPLQLEISQRFSDKPTRLGNISQSMIRKSLLFLADITAIAKIEQENTKLISSPQVCLELGYALSSKKSGEILLLNQQRTNFVGEFPFDLPEHQLLRFKEESELSETLSKLLKSLLRKFNLFM
jgi:hypothetical protein